MMILAPKRREEQDSDNEGRGKWSGQTGAKKKAAFIIGVENFCRLNLDHALVNCALSNVVHPELSYNIFKKVVKKIWAYISKTRRTSGKSYVTVLSELGQTIDMFQNEKVLIPSEEKATETRQRKGWLGSDGGAFASAFLQAMTYLKFFGNGENALPRADVAIYIRNELQ
ncbi:hypothetical protein HAX54_004772, partial [Datura stramonium]|nr:hypothetical protein [Datura stramonium]